MRPPPFDVDTFDWLRELDDDPAPLHAALATLPTRRVGHYAEGLVHYALSHSSRLSLVAVNLPLRVQKQTVGECDFLLEDREGRRLHWELAVKCYLHVDASGLADPLASFVGPALGDPARHQAQPDAQPPTAALGPCRLRGLAAAGAVAGADVGQRLVVRPFRCLARGGRGLAIDPRLQPDLLTGFWAAARTWPDVSAALGAQGWTRLPRLRWIAPLAAPDPSFCDRDTMGARIADVFAMPSNGRDDPFAIAAWKRDVEGRWHEIARGFIVADDWEARAIAFAAT
ncbi:MAG: DUF1853 family protein [Pararobbsia sp.]